MYLREDYVTLTQRLFSSFGFPFSPDAFRRFETPQGSLTDPVRISESLAGWSSQENGHYTVSFAISISQISIDVMRSAKEARNAVLEALEALVENAETLNGPGQTHDLSGG